MAYYDIMCFLEYYADRTNVLDPITGKRAPTRRWQNFYQAPTPLSIDLQSTGDYVYLAFDVDGFSAVEASSMGDLSVTLAAIGDIVDLTESAVADKSLAIAMLLVQDAGNDSIDVGSAHIIAKYTGTISNASMDDTSVDWTISPLIDTKKAHVPTRKISADFIGSSAPV